MKNLSLLPTCGTQFYQYKRAWKRIYSEDFSPKEKTKIINELKNALNTTDFEIEHIWGDEIEDRGSQITYSALGQQAPIEEKTKWDTDFAKRKKIQEILSVSIPEFSVHLGGTTSVDITKPGIDKAYGIMKLRDKLNIEIKEMIFIGDAIFPGGNDYPAKETGAVSIRIKDPEETKRVIETIIACLGSM